MSIHNLERMFAPRSVAVIGASDRLEGVGGSVLRNLGTGYEGRVFPVNSRSSVVQGRQAWPSIEQLPEVPDLAVICTPAATVPDLVRQCGRAGVGAAIILSAGFREIGEPGREAEEHLRVAASEFPHLRLLGPNCLGAIVPRLRMSASFAADMPQEGRVAFISQSGALCTAVLDWAIEERIGFSYFVSLGNMLDVGVADLIDYFGSDPHTDSLILYLESITCAREFMSAARAFTRTKPIIAYKSGRFAESAKAATSHTGAMAGEDAVFDAAFRRAGIVRVFEIDELFDTAELLARQRTARGPRLGIVTNAGGPGVIATDALIARGGKLAALAPDTIQALNEFLPPFWSHANPVDVLGDATAERVAHATQLVLDDVGVDAVLVMITPQAMTDATQIATAIAEIARRQRKPVLAVWMGRGAVREGIEVLNASGVPTYPFPERAISAFMHLVEYGRNLEILYETPRESVPYTGWSETTPCIPRDRELLTEIEAKSLLAHYGIPTVVTQAAASADEATRIAQEIGYPVAMKILSPDITHKTDVGGVVLDLRTEDEVRTAFAQITQRAHANRPDAKIEGVSIQRMYDRTNGRELILGAKQDATFGAVLLLGAGGTAAEVLKDRALELPPLNERLARRMIESLRSCPLLCAHRGRPAIDFDRLVEVLIRFSYLIAENPAIREFDINPLLATPAGSIALDARALVDQRKLEAPTRPYAHLAIRPFPAQYMKHAKLADGTDVVLRPIRPEDEPMWYELFHACSPESIRARFGYMLKNPTHTMAARFCMVDYDREIAIVAEVEEGPRKLIAGIGRLVADPDHRTAEYAILIADRWQNRGLGLQMTGFCLEIAADWGVAEVFAETDWQNRRMLSAFAECGFSIEQCSDGRTRVRKRLDD